MVRLCMGFMKSARLTRGSSLSQPSQLIIPVLPARTLCHSCIGYLVRLQNDLLGIWLVAQYFVRKFYQLR